MAFNWHRSVIHNYPLILKYQDKPLMLKIETRISLKHANPNRTRI